MCGLGLGWSLSAWYLWACAQGWARHLLETGEKLLEPGHLMEPLYCCNYCRLIGALIAMSYVACVALHLLRLRWIVHVISARRLQPPPAVQGAATP